MIVANTVCVAIANQPESTIIQWNIPLNHFTIQSV